MREILFKAKRLSDGKWVEGYYQKRKDAFENDEHLIFRCESCHAWEYVEVEPETLCQYTGLTDKNANKIWENDIVCTPYIDPIFKDMVNDEILDDFRWKVVFYEGVFCVENEDTRIYLRDFVNNIKVIKNHFDD